MLTKKSLLQRTISSITVFGIFLLGLRYVPFILGALFAAFSSDEYSSMLRTSFGLKPRAGERVRFIVFCSIIAASGAFGINVAAGLSVLFALIEILADMSLTLQSDFVPSPTNVAWLACRIAGIFYLGIPLSCSVSLAGIHKFWLVYAVVITATGENTALLAGVTIGRHRIVQQLSPNKTLEGFIAQVAGSALACLVFDALDWLPANTIQGHWLLVSVLLSLAGILGDLFESYLKRNCGFKDMSTLLPGTGGLLDRIDGLLFVFPLLLAMVVHYSSKHVTIIGTA